MRTKATQRPSAQTEQRAARAEPDFAGQRMPGAHGTAGLLLSLQRSQGNRFVQRMLDAAVLQRACSTCVDCRNDAQPDHSTLPPASPALPLIRTKLAVSQPGDPYEQEAERVAEEVMRMPAPDMTARLARSMPPPVISRQSAAIGAGHLARQEDQPAEEEPSLLSFKEMPGASHDIGPDLESKILQIHGGGEPLSSDLRSFFEPRFGVDFSNVRIHTNSAAADTVQRVQARAYTLGTDVAFAPGEFQPNSQEGRKLLAHELTHVVQQGAEVRTVMRACDCTAPGRSAPSASKHAALSAAFPNLRRGDYCITAPEDPSYNCIAWTIGNTSTWIWDEVDRAGNNNGTVDISDFDAFYANIGLTPVVDSTPANPKVALYAIGSTPTHGALRTGSGACRFESKLGRNVRIVHEAYQLEGGTLYGDINRYYV